VLRLTETDGILDMLQSNGCGAEELLHLERFGYDLSPRARKRSKVTATHPSPSSVCGRRTFSRCPVSSSYILVTRWCPSVSSPSGRCTASAAVSGMLHLVQVLTGRQPVAPSQESSNFAVGDQQSEASCTAQATRNDCDGESLATSSVGDLKPVPSVHSRPGRFPCATICDACYLAKGIVFI